MGCPICRELQRAYENRLSEYLAARSSVVYGMSKKLAAQKNVEMERARYEMEEHQVVCVLGMRPAARLPMAETPEGLSKLVA